MTTAENLVLLKYLYCLREMVAQDSAGRRTVVEQNSATSLLYTGYNLVNTTGGQFTAYQATPGLVYSADYISYIDFTSNVGGTIDADVTLKAALADYYGVVRLGRIWASANLAAGATLVLENGAGVAIRTLVLPALTANTPSDCIDGLYVYALLKTDNSKLYIDTTSANWGNATAVHIEILSHYET